MKRKGVLVLFITVIFYWITCQFSWHLNRNSLNVLPKGELTQIDISLYQDENHLIWELQPHLMNVFHQPEGVIESVEIAYPNMDTSPMFDIENPNLKLLRKTKDGGSHEAILQPNGTYLSKGPKKATYNYGHPEGVWGMTKHIILDVFPHFANSDYK